MGKSEASAITSLDYRVSYGVDGWTSRVADTSIEELGEFFRETPPEEFLTAMDACCDAFYPELARADRPWHQHAQITDESERLSFLREKAEKAWPLDWYWKVLITYLPEWLEREDKTSEEASPGGPPRQGGVSEIAITLSQVRRWVLLVAHGTSSDRGLSAEADNGYELLRPPIFGRSNRLADWDQYWLYLLQSKTIAAAWRRLQRNNDRLWNAYIMGRHDLTYRLHRDQVRVSGNYIDVSVGGKLKLNTHLRENSPLPGVNRMEVPNDLVFVPGFQNPGKPPSGELVERDAAETEEENGGDKGGKRGLRPKQVPLLLASEAVCQVLATLSEVWNDPTIQSVHINAPPGSGKEVLTQTVYWFQERSGFLAVASWYPGSPETNQRALYGGADGHGGLVEQARRGCLVLDEIDKAENEIRVSLLRLLENGQYIVPGKSRIANIERGDRPVYVCLSSRPVEEVLSLYPPDFWTRVQMTIEMAHPFSARNEEERLRVIAEYFQMFWNVHIEEFFSLPANERVLTSVSTGVIRDYFKRIVELLVSGTFSRFVARSFAKVATSRYKRISVRNVRTIAERAVFNFVQRFIYNVDLLSGTPLMEDFSDGKGLRKKLERAIHDGDFGELLEDWEVRREVERVVEHSMGGRVDYPG